MLLSQISSLPSSSLVNDKLLLLFTLGSMNPSWLERRNQKISNSSLKEVQMQKILEGEAEAMETMKTTKKDKSRREKGWINNFKFGWEVAMNSKAELSNSKLQIVMLGFMETPSITQLYFNPQKAVLSMWLKTDFSLQALSRFRLLALKECTQMWRALIWSCWWRTMRISWRLVRFRLKM